jgi:hypothetical protein
MIGGCPLTTQYDFTIPSYSPSGVALFAWTWFNEIGNREMYMTCAHVQILGSSASRRSRSKRQGTFTSLSSLPNIWRANTEGLNTCGTTEGLDIVFPEPGPDVIYAGTRSSSSPLDTQTGCDTVTPLGQTYENLGDTASVSAGSSSAIASSSSSKPTTAGSGGGIFAQGANSTTTR